MQTYFLQMLCYKKVRDKNAGAVWFLYFGVLFYSTADVLINFDFFKNIRCFDVTKEFSLLQRQLTGLRLHHAIILKYSHITVLTKLPMTLTYFSILSW